MRKINSDGGNEMGFLKKTKNQIITQLGAMFLNLASVFFLPIRDFFSLARFHFVLGTWGDVIT